MQELAEFCCGTGAVADLVLDVKSKFCECLVIAVGLEDGVVAEALPSPAFADDLSVDDAFELMDLPL